MLSCDGKGCDCAGEDDVWQLRIVVQVMPTGHEPFRKFEIDVCQDCRERLFALLDEAVRKLTKRPKKEAAS